ncbi:thiamine ABC transporter substrate-binding protein [Treponema sp.]|jgi:thiamine transport system substrate-binding protein|uniref:thiamine ABC transporter substrate-binding protein n=1 Tax=Treponema sp. TaxID=166 RepID=UPI00257D221E|nr:thiamine ABC transporter substrate-binding protein [Treponema sp.]
MLNNTFKILSATAISAALLITTGCQKKSRTEKEVVVYTYDSFGADWAFGPELAAAFKEETGYEVKYVIAGSAVEAFEKLLAEKDKPQADVILGIDNNLAQRAIDAGILEPYEAHGIKFIPEHLQEALGSGNYLTPYDYSHFAVIYDTQSDIPAPQDLESLTSKTYADKLILMDPRTSSTGLGFLSWTVSVYGDQNEAYWKRLAPSVHAMTKGWSEGWGLFTKGEAPLCISYTTSPAYCAIEENNERYVALTFDEGHVMQVEGAGLVKGAYNTKGAKTFIDYLISTEMQKKLPLKQWMYPANKMARINKAFSKVSPVPETTLPTDNNKTQEAVEKAVAAINK